MPTILIHFLSRIDDKDGPPKLHGPLAYVTDCGARVASQQGPILRAGAVRVSKQNDLARIFPNELDCQRAIIEYKYCKTGEDISRILVA